MKFEEIPFLPEWLLRCLFFQVLQSFGDNSIFNYHTFQLKTIVVVLLKENVFRERGKVKSFFSNTAIGKKKVKNVRKRQKYKKNTNSPTTKFVHHIKLNLTSILLAMLQKQSKKRTSSLDRSRSNLPNMTRTSQHFLTGEIQQAL